MAEKARRPQEEQTRVARHKYADQCEEVPVTEHPAADVVPAAKSTVREARLSLALSVDELDARAGVTSRTVLLVERGEVTPHMATMRKLSAALGCRPHGIAWPGDPFTALYTP
jgi:ribosome-binding protein aMBF1 (putative translation factor)